jgi:chaperonin GroES
MSDNEREVGEIKIPMEKLVSSPNIALLLSKEQLMTIGLNALEGYMEDKNTRQEWEQRNEKAIKMTLQVVEEKSFPWTNCSNVKFPLVTVAALQFLARMSILTKGRQIAKCDVIGSDPKGLENARAKRIGAHMSYQLVEEDTEWINDDEKAKFAASIMGCAFKKTAFDPVQGINVSSYVPAANLVVNYFTKTLKQCPRSTEILTMTANDVQERVRRKVFCKMEAHAGSSMPLPNLLRDTADQVQGLQRPASSSIGTFEILEQHCYLDLDDDDYEEPYIVFVRSDTGQVLRIVARYFDEGDVHRVNDAKCLRLRNNADSSSSPEAKKLYESEAERLKNAKDNFVVRIDPQQFYTKYTFIPSVDGGFYDLGFGALLGPVNAAVDTLINQQIDAGTMQVTAGGFLGRGVKLKGGRNNFDPFEWKPVDSTGDDLRKSIVPLPVNAPSPVLFQMLGLLISYAEKVSGSTDIMTGVSPGQNTPAETSRNTVEQGMKLFSGIYGRMHRAFKDELSKLYRLNQIYLETTPTFVMLSSGDGAIITQNDYKRGNFKVQPAADVQVVSESQRQQKASMVLQAAHNSPGYNMYLVNREYLEAFDVQGIDQLLPDPKGPLAIPPMPNPKVELEKAKMQLAQEQFHFEAQKGVFEMKQSVDLQAAEIHKLEAQAAKLLADANGVDIGHQIAAINAQTGAAKAHQEGQVKALGIMQKTYDLHQKKQELSLKEADAAKPKSPEGAANEPS